MLSKTIDVDGLKLSYASSVHQQQADPGERVHTASRPSGDTGCHACLCEH